MAGFPNYNVPPPVQIIGAPPVTPQQPMQPPQQPVTNLGEIQAQLAEGMRQRELATALMSQGYTPNSGGLGALAQVFSAFAGKKLDKKAGESVSSAAARQFAEEERRRLSEIDREEAQWQRHFGMTQRAALAKARIAAGNKTYQVVDAGAAGLMYNTPNGLVPVSQGMPNRGQSMGEMPEQGSMEAYVAAANMLREAGVPPDQIEIMLADAPGMMPADEDNQPEVGQQYVGGAPSGISAPGGAITSSSYQQQQAAAAREAERLRLAQESARRDAMGTAPAGQRFNMQTGELEDIPGYVNPANKKPLPQATMKLVTDEKTIADTTDIINSQIDKFIGQIESGTLDLGLLNNLASRAMNNTGQSSESSRAYGSFMAGLEKQRNDSLRLNKGVQTEGDAERAWREIFEHPNDGPFVLSRLKEIRGYNEQARLLRLTNIEMIYQNFGKDVPKWERPTGNAPANDGWGEVRVKP